MFAGFLAKRWWRSRSACACAALLVTWFVLPVDVQAQRAISWAVAANELELSEGGSVTVACPPNGRPGQVWGTDVYTDDSSICSAAQHAGVITRTDGGTVIVRRRAGQQAYNGSARNGVVSSDYGPWDASFTVASAGPPPVVRVLERRAEPAMSVPAREAAPEIISWSRTASKLAPNGAHFTFLCPAHGTAAMLRGVDVYSWDSSICTAAVHAGAITLERGGVVTVEMRPGLASYAGAARHGITSETGARTTLGFVIMRR